MARNNGSGVVISVSMSPRKGESRIVSTSETKAKPSQNGSRPIRPSNENRSHRTVGTPTWGSRGGWEEG